MWRAPIPYQKQQTPSAYSDPPQSASLLLSGLSALLLLLMLMLLLDAARWHSPDPTEDLRMETRVTAGVTPKSTGIH